MRSIRRYLTCRLLFGLFVLVLGSNALLYYHVYGKTVAQFDKTLLSRARDLASMTEQDSEGISVEWREEFLPEFAARTDPGYFQIWNEDGQVVIRSPSLEGLDLPRITGSIGVPRFWNLVLPDGRPGRAIGMRFSPYIDEEDLPFVKDPKELQIVLAMDRAGIRSMLRLFLYGSLFVTMILSTGIIMMVPRVIVSGLSPLNDLSRHTSSIDVYRLGSRYPTDDLPDELVPIVTRLNELLDRIEKAFERERRLAADIAHELKTPIAELRSLSEVAIKWSDDMEFVNYSLKNTVEIACQMDRIVSLLLALNRCERDRQAVCPAPVELVGLVGELWRPWQKTAAEKEMDVEFQMPDKVVVSTDRTMLSSIITNLFANAVEYSPRGGHFKCLLREGAERISLLMQNSNDLLKEEDLPHIFEYLWRKEASRSSSTHTGLGLALVQTFARYLGIEVGTRLLASGDFCIALEIPVAFPARTTG